MSSSRPRSVNDCGTALLRLAESVPGALRETEPSSSVALLVPGAGQFASWL